MDFKQLEAFVRTVELSSFSKAAESLFISQPSVSVYVNALETELGTKLLSRTAKDVSPTRDGRVFYEYAKNLLSLREEAVFSMESRSSSYHGELELHASSVPAQYILPELIVAFNRVHPSITFRITMSDTFNVISSVIAQKCEIGVVGAKTETGKCDYRLITSESIVLIGPPDTRLTELNLTELLYSENFITREEGSATRYHAEEYLTMLNLKPSRLRVVAQLTNTHSVVYAVSKGLGVSVVSEIAAREYIDTQRVKVLRPEGVDLKRDFYFVWRKDALLSPKLNLFVQYVCDSFAAGKAGPA